MFSAYNGLELGKQLELSWEVYHDKDKMKKLVANAMNLDRSWSVSMKKYLDVYKKALAK